MIDRRANARHQVFVGGAIAGITSLLTFAAIAPSKSDTMFLALLASGPATALYGAVIFSARGDGLRTILGAISIALAGLSHVAWLLMLLAIATNLFPSIRIGGDPESAALFLLTGLGYAALTSLCTGSWISLAIMLPAALIAGACATMPGSSNDNFGMGIACAVLHASIGASLIFPTLAAIERRWRPGLCRTCGYDLNGVFAPRCPECGNLRAKSAEQASAAVS